MVSYKSGLIAANKKSLRTKQWYNQRFDGCLNFIWMISEAELKQEKRKIGAHFTSHICIFENHRADWYIDQADIIRVTEIFLKKLHQEKHLGKKLIKQWQPDNKKFLSSIDKLEQINLVNISDKKLADLYLDFSEVYSRTISSSSLIDGFALGSDEIIQAEINDLLDQRMIMKGRGNIFSILTAPVHQSFINEAEIALLQMAAKIKALRGARNAYQRPAIKRMLVAHTKKYFWTKNNYNDNHILTVEHFIKETAGIISSKININHEITRIKNTPALSRKAKSKLLARLRPEAYLRNLLEISEDFTYWQDERKKRTFLFTHYASLLLQEIGRRRAYPLSEMKYLTRAEVSQFLHGRQFSHLILKERSRYLIIYEEGNKYEAASGTQASNLAKYIFKNKNYSDIRDFRGLTACAGKVRGRAKIVTSVKDIGKVKSGDIMVAVMTRPDYIIGIKKAAAIVTDEGGITCHAAIISRELGIPCIIGTKIGTKVLKDGDIIEVNANHGWVRKIK